MFEFGTSIISNGLVIACVDFENNKCLVNIFDRSFKSFHVPGDFYKLLFIDDDNNYVYALFDYTTISKHSLHNQSNEWEPVAALEPGSKLITMTSANDIRVIDPDGNYNNRKVLGFWTPGCVFEDDPERIHIYDNNQPIDLVVPCGDIKSIDYDHYKLSVLTNDHRLYVDNKLVATDCLDFTGNRGIVILHTDQTISTYFNKEPIQHTNLGSFTEIYSTKYSQLVKDTDNNILEIDACFKPLHKRLIDVTEWKITNSTK
jgi:hypothetical protein